MSIFRTNKKQNPFAQIDRKLLEDDKLSWQAKGLLCYLLSKPDGWKTYMADIQNRSKNGKTSVQSIIKELSEAGYMQKELGRDEQGRLNGWNWQVFENPTHVNDTDSQENRQTENPSAGNPSDGKPATSNNDYSNKEYSNNDKSNIPLNPLSGNGVEEVGIFGSNSSNKQSSTQTETSHETQLRVRVHKIFIISKEPPIFPRDGSEERAWRKLRPFIREEDVQTLEDFYRLPKSEEYDRTWQRRKDARHLMYHWQEQLELAREHFVYQRKKFLGEENKMDPEEHYNRYVSNF